jgi:hypothetical protein
LQPCLEQYLSIFLAEDLVEVPDNTYVDLLANSSSLTPLLLRHHCGCSTVGWVQFKRSDACESWSSICFSTGILNIGIELVGKWELSVKNHGRGERQL